MGCYPELEIEGDLEPLKQGELDSLCGLYSIINAIRLTIYPERVLTAKQQADLFRHGLAYHSRKRSVARLMREGMSKTAWIRLCGELIVRASATTGIAIRHKLLFKSARHLRPRRALRRIKRHTDTGQPVLICLPGHHDHYSVVIDHRNGRLRLFDSSHLNWISMRSCGVGSASRSARRRLSKRSAIALYR